MCNVFLFCLTLVLLQAQEISHLIACQPTALKAVRLQALVPSYPDTKDKGDALDKLDVSTCLWFFLFLVRFGFSAGQAAPVAARLTAD